MHSRTTETTNSSCRLILLPRLSEVAVETSSDGADHDDQLGEQLDLIAHQKSDQLACDDDLIIDSSFSLE